MTLKVAVIAEGNADSAVKAMDHTAAAVNRVDAANENVAASSNEAAAAATREQAATQAAAAASRAHETALRAQAAAARATANAQRNLAFQMNDVVVSIISGQALWMVAAQQGAQIAQIYGPGEGGAGRAFREMGNMAVGAVTKLWPLIAATALFSIGVAGITKEINSAGYAAKVSFGDVALGVFQAIGDRLYNLVKPAVDAVSGWFEDNWDTIVTITKNTGNVIVGTFVLAVEDVKSAFAALPNALGDIVVQSAQNVINGITSMVREAIATINGMIASVNGLLTKAGLPAIGDLGNPNRIVPDVDLPNPFAGALTDLQKEFEKNRQAAFGEDYMGDFFDDVAAHARTNLADRTKDKKAKPLSDYAREIAQIRERTAALDIERRTIGMSTYDATKLQKVFELENAARKDSIGLTAARVVQIQKEAAANAAAAVALEQTKFVYDSLKDAWSGFFSEFRSNVREGQTLWESLANAGVSALDRLTDRFADFAADQAFNLVFKTLFGGAGNFIGGSLGAPALQLGYQVGVAHSGARNIGTSPLPTRIVPPSLFANAPRLHSGLAADEFPAILQTGEEVVPRGGSRTGGDFTYQDNRQISIGAGVSMAEVRQMMAEDRAQLLQKLPAAVRAARNNPRRASA